MSLFAESAIPETDFLAEIVRRTGCGLLLDVNNVECQRDQSRLRPAPAYLARFRSTMSARSISPATAEAEDDAGLAC